MRPVEGRTRLTFLLAFTELPPHPKTQLRSATTTLVYMCVSLASLGKRVSVEMKLGSNFPILRLVWSNKAVKATGDT